jgi:hypothetical protein
MSRIKMTSEIIDRIRKEVVGGKTKYQVAKEMNISAKLVYYHTNDLPNSTPGRTEIRGKTLILLKQLLAEGYAYSGHNSTPNFRTLQKHFPVIQRAQINGKKTIYFIDDKNMIALKAIMKNRKSKIISYHELSKISKLFNVRLSPIEKDDILGKKSKRILPTIRKKEGGFMSSFRKNQMKLDDFIDQNDFLHRFSSDKSKNNVHSKGDSLLEKLDSFVDFCIRKYCYDWIFSWLVII